MKILSGNDPGGYAYELQERIKMGKYIKKGKAQKTCIICKEPYLGGSISKYCYECKDVKMTNDYKIRTLVRKIMEIAFDNNKQFYKREEELEELLIKYLNKE